MNTGDEGFDALLALGWNVTISDSGDIVAVKDGISVRGIVQDDCTISWQGYESTVQWAVKQSRIRDLRERVQKTDSMRRQESGEVWQGQRMFPEP